jgi:predicted nucleotidyltransferase
MIDSLEFRLAEVAELCRKYRVKKFEVFGSAVDGDWKPATSDLDFLVDFLPMPPAEHSKSYFGLWFDLQDLFRRNVDLVETPAIRNARKRFAEWARHRRQSFAAIKSKLTSSKGEPAGAIEIGNGRWMFAFGGSFVSYVIKEQPVALFGKAIPFLVRRQIVVTEIFAI